MKYILSLAASLLAASLPLGAYDLHEWGKFTTVSGSDGVLLPGLEVEEAALPAYVHAFPGFAVTGKGMPLPVRNVTVKMETPVLYFHSDTSFRAKVAVGFQGGAISQSYRNGVTEKTCPPTAGRPPLLISESRAAVGSNGISMCCLRKIAGRPCSSNRTIPPVDPRPRSGCELRST